MTVSFSVMGCRTISRSSSSSKSSVNSSSSQTSNTSNSNGSSVNEPFSQLNRLTTPKLGKETKVLNYEMSSTTYNSYMSFAKKFTSLMMEVNNGKEEASLGISIPDAYICLAITGAISTDEARDDVISYLGLSNMDELRQSIKEILATLATLYRNSDNKLVGGYNLNSIWLNPDKVSLIKEKDEQLYQDLEEVFDASLYLEALTSDKANQYMRENGLKDMPVPEIKLDDKDPCALNVMSAYYCLDYFPEEIKQSYEYQYKNGNHKMDYTYDGQTSKVDYIGQVNHQNVYEGSNFYGSTLGIGYLNMAYFLPNDKDALPSSILDDVLNENYGLKQSSYVNYEGRVQETTIHEVTINAPYFSLNNEGELKHADLEKILPIITNYGAGQRIADPRPGYWLYLDFIKQFSVMKFNYDGFYSCSVTISGIKEASAPAPIEYEKFNLTLDHPYIFEVRKNVMIDKKDFVNVPIVIGEIVNPEYSE